MYAGISAGTGISNQTAGKSGVTKGNRFGKKVA